MTSYFKTVKYLYGLQSRGIKFGRKNIRTLLKSVGNPEHAFLSIHIAGTNGKGSTAAFLASIFTEGGNRTGLYTSPHLVDFTERIRINGRQISESRLVEYVRRLSPAIEETNATFFEATTCAAFMYFAEENVDIAIVETGMGGRLDATNVLLPLISVITNVSFDHMEYLGNTLSAIAREKGGIMKRQIPVVTGSEEPKVLSTLESIARRKGSVLHLSNQIVQSSQCVDKIGTHRLTFRSKHINLMNIELGFNGPHQITNAELALSAVELLKRNDSQSDFAGRLSNAVISRGLSNVTKNTGLRGRFETVSNGKVILDVAHNQEAMDTLVGLIHRLGLKPVVVFGVMKDKSFGIMLESLRRIASTLVVVSPTMDRALAARDLLKEAKDRGISAVLGGSVSRGIEMAKRLAGRKQKILVTGSHYVVGGAIRHLSKKRVDKRGD